MSLIENPQKELISFSGDQIDLLKQTYAKNLTTEEFLMFLQIAKSTGLNPFLKEIVPSKFINKKDGTTNLSFITTRDGYLAYAQRYYPDEYDGIISFTVCENDTFEIDAANYSVIHKFGLGGRGRGRILGAWARCDRKGRKPQICFVPFDEYFKENWEVWKTFPSAMIQKVAEAFVLKRQFTINGLVTREEIGFQEAEEKQLPSIDIKPIPKIESPKPQSPNGEVKPEPQRETILISVPKIAKPEEKPEPLSPENMKLPPKPSFNRKKKTSRPVIQGKPILAGDDNDDGIPDNADELVAQALEEDQLEDG